MAKLLDIRQPDGTRCFAFEPEAGLWDVPALVRKLEGAVVTRSAQFATTGQARVEFNYAGQVFAVEIDECACSLLVQDPACADDILLLVRAHLFR